MTARIFISYSRKDETFARRLATSLCLLGADVWIDLEDIPVGVKWSTAIQEGLNTSEVMIVILSPDSMASSNVEDEWKYFLDQKKPVVPVLYKQCPIHFQLNRLQRIHFHEREYETAFAELHTELVERGFSFDKTPDQLPANHPIIPPSQQTLQQRRSWLITAGVAALVLAVLVMGYIFLNPQLDPRQTSQTQTWEAASTAAWQAASLPTETQTPQPTASFAPTGTPAPTETPRPTATLAPILAVTTIAQPTLAPTDLGDVGDAPTTEPNAVLIYDDTSLILLNRSSRPVSLNGLLFVQRTANGTTLSFRSSEWTGTMGSSQLASGACVQIAQNVVRLPVRSSLCQSRPAWKQVGERNWFWIGDSRGAAFEVRQGNELLATCSIRAGECGLALPS